MRKPTLKPGDLFVVPLLRGGYAFGYVTWSEPRGWSFANICEGVADDPERVPEDPLAAPKAVVDMVISRNWFVPETAPGRDPWRLLGESVGSNVSPDTRYYRMGSAGLFKLVDLRGEEPVRQVSEAEAMRYPAMKVDFGATPTAIVEVAVKKLDITPLAYAKAWRAEQDAG